MNWVLGKVVSRATAATANLWRHSQNQQVEGTLHVDITRIDHLRWPSVNRRTELRIDLATPDFTLPALLVINPGAKQLIILNNGAVDRERSQGKPVFQRSTWSYQIPAHQLFLCDPLTTGQGPLSLAWGQVTSETTIYPAVHELVAAVSRRLGVVAQDRTYFGSSAGGFMALMEHGLDPGSRALVNNAQFDWTRWWAAGVMPMLSHVFGGATAAETRKTHPLRTNALAHLQRTRVPPRFTYLVNLASKHDRTVELPQYHNFVAEHAGERSQLVFQSYFDAHSGHGPLSITKTLPFFTTPPALP